MNKPNKYKILKLLKYIIGSLIFIIILTKISSFIFDDRPDLFKEHNIVMIEDPIRISHYHFRNFAGKDHSFDNYRGKYSILAFWATWCGYCAKEFPKMDEFAAKNRDIPIIPIPHTEDTPSEIARFYSKLGIKNLPSFWNYGSGLHRHMQIRGYPTFYIIDDQARVVAHSRPNWKSNSLKDAIMLLKQYNGAI